MVLYFCFGYTSYDGRKQSAHKGQLYGTTEYATINYYVPCVGRFQCKIMDVERFRPTICKEIKKKYELKQQV